MINSVDFKSFKNFTFTNNDSGSGVFLVKARSGSYKQYVSSSDAITHIISGSVTSSFYALPTWNMINKTFYPCDNLQQRKDLSGLGCHQIKHY